MNAKGNVNKMILVGRLGQTPELRHTPKGTPVTTLSVAYNRNVKTAEGAYLEETDWHRATVWGKAAEACANHLIKGSRVYLEGELLMKSWKDREGNEKKSAEIDVDEIVFLGGNPAGPRAMPSPALDESMEPEVSLAM